MAKVRKWVIHITTLDNCESIIKNGFNISIHNVDISKNQIQWLGDGIYFWDANDPKTIETGKKLVSKKRKNKNRGLSSISFILEVEAEKYMNLDEDKWERKFNDFLQNINLFPDGRELINMIKTVEEMNGDINSTTLNQLGLLFGTAMNAYMKIIKQKNIEIDVVSHAFFHRGKKKIMFGNNNVFLNQFCIKNKKIIENIPTNKWYIEKQI